MSPQEMVRLQKELGAIILRDPAVKAIGSQTGSTDSPNPANTGSFTIVLKPRDQRGASARQVIDRLRPQFAQVPGANVFLQPGAGHQCRCPARTRQLAIHIAGRRRRRTGRVVAEDAGEDANLAAACRRNERSSRQCPAAQDHHQPRSGIAFRHHAAIDRRHAQRRLWAAPDHAVFTPSSIPISSSWKFCRNCRRPVFARPAVREIAADRRRRSAVDASSTSIPSKAGPLPDHPSGAISRGHADVQSAPRDRARTGGRCVNARRGRARHAAADHLLVPGRRPGVSAIAVEHAGADPGASLVVVYIILGILYESFIHPLTILSTLPSAGIGALLALRFGGMESR